MQIDKTYVLTIAGYDPCGGAGVLADVKTFEQHGVYGLAVNTALTIQNESDFRAVHWHSWPVIKAQLDILFEKYPIRHCKIGLIEHPERLVQVLDYLHAENASICIVLDPVFRASAGFDFKNQTTWKEAQNWLKKITVITPNLLEIKLLCSDMSADEGAENVSKYCAVLLKGGHSVQKKGVDRLYYDGKQLELYPEAGDYYEKHGSGCVFSAALAARFALGDALEEACRNAKRYISYFLASSTGLLGRHVQKTDL